MEISQETREKIQRAVKALVEASRKIREWFMNFFRDNWKRIKEAAIKWYQLEEEKEMIIRRRYKRDFNRQKISHQVINRKPQHMVRKIIR